MNDVYIRSEVIEMLESIAEGATETIVNKRLDDKIKELIRITEEEKARQEEITREIEEDRRNAIWVTLEELKDDNFKFETNTPYSMKNDQISSWFSYRGIKDLVPGVIDILYDGMTPDDTEYVDLEVDGDIEFSMDIINTNKSYWISNESRYNRRQMDDEYSIVVELHKFQFNNNTHYIYWTVTEKDYQNDEE